ncbi:MAG: glycosyltransferase [Micromonosporaceae bacterium]|nr:glycosyltransferase [Micromonosporaceae bacterium]
MTDVPRIVRNDWSTLQVPELGRWRPELTVSVVIPAYQCQASLDLALAALSRQTYPAELLDVVVVDDGSDPPLTLPGLRPARCRLVRPAAGWGRANALHAGAGHAGGDILHWLDADLIVDPSHVEAQARWHHRLPYAVTLGWKRFVDVHPDGPSWPTPAQATDPDALAGLFAGHRTEPHDYVEREIARTGQLRSADHLGFLVHVGATAALRRELYEATGGIDTGLRLGEDTEFGYRLAQAGAVFVPEPQARSWHLGATHMMRHEQALQRYNRPFLAERMPQPRWLRRSGGSGWSVPLVTVVMTVDGQPLERVRVAVDSVLRGDETDLRVLLVGAWGSLSDQRVSPLSDPLLDLRLVAASYRSDPRVRLVERAPDSAYPSPFLLWVPATCALARPAVRRLVEHADRHRLGLVRVPDAEAGSGSGSASGSGSTVELWRTAALHRAGWVRRDGDPVADAVREVHGAGSVDAKAIGVVDLSDVPVAELAARAGSVPAGRWLPASVEVAGVRSLARASWVVARLAAARLARRAGSRLRGRAV